jgi:hypothetical protein
MGSRPGRRLKVSDHRDKISSPLKFLGELSTSVVAEAVEETGPAWKELTWSLKRPLRVMDRDRGTPRGATPPTPPGIRVTYHGGSTGLSVDRDMESGETERVEVVVAQGLLDRRVSGHAPEPRRRTGGDRCIELGYATTAQFVEAVVPVLPLPPKIRA